MLLKLVYWLNAKMAFFFHRRLSKDVVHVLKRGLLRCFLRDRITDKLIKSWRTARKNKSSKKNLGLADGVNLIGYLQAAKGISEAARSNLLAIGAAKIPCAAVNYDAGVSPSLKTEPVPPALYLNKFIFHTNIIHINPPQLPDLWKKFKKKDLIGRYTIGVWYWELPNFPEEWRFAFDLVDEVWVASQFVFDSVSAVSTVPVIKIPPCVEVESKCDMSRLDFGLPSDAFLFLCSYDVLSVQKRKNPESAIEAFKRAFLMDDLSVGLVIKVNNAQEKPEEIKEIKNKMRGYLNYYILDEVFDRAKMDELLNLIDVYISLHRSEGFGLVPAEAMFLGKPVVMTNWSGNVDFMTKNNSCGVDFKFIPVGSNAAPYDANQVWAEPDISHATEYLKQLVVDTAYYQAISLEASKTIREQFSSTKTGSLIRKRLSELKLI